MSDSEESGITHTTVSSLYEDLSDIGSPRADDHELLEPPYMLEDPYAEAAFQAPPSPDYVPGPELADDEIVAGDQPYAEDASPMAHSPDDVPESDPEADPEEDDDEDPEEDPIDYPADGGDDGDDEMDIEEDEDDDMDIETDEEDEDDEMDIEMDEEGGADPRLHYPPQMGVRSRNWVPGMGRRELRICLLIGPSWWSFRAEYGALIATEWTERVRRDLREGQRQLLAGRVNMLFRDRRTHAHTRQLMETEAGMSREAWRRAMDSSDLAHGGVISLRTTVYAQMEEITELQSADRRRQRAMSELLETDRRRREEMRELRAADRTRQQQIVQTLTALWKTLSEGVGVPLQGLVTTFLHGTGVDIAGQRCYLY
ncbi:hypothetical protein Tco_0559725 [Tanacetum coccineum]